MNSTRTDFQTEGPSWSNRAGRGELIAVFSPDASENRNLYLHKVSLRGAEHVLKLVDRPGKLLDFGCGTGRTLRYFARHGWSVVGTEITREMLDEARRIGLPPGAEVHVTNGVNVPLSDASVDVVWVCGVLKYSLFPPGAVCRGGTGTPPPANDDPTSAHKGFVAVHRDIAREMFRVLKPGGFVVSNEMYVDAPPEVFIRDFEDVGFLTNSVHVLQRYFEPFAKVLQSPRMPRWCVVGAARLYSGWRMRFDNPWRSTPGLRDYLFVWHKPRA